jgi:hypothetical protein
MEFDFNGLGVKVMRNALTYLKVKYIQWQHLTTHEACRSSTRRWRNWVGVSRICSASLLTTSASRYGDCGEMKVERGDFMVWSPYKDRIIAYVAAHPGCCKCDVAAACTHNRQRNPSKQYYLVNTALRNGWIVGIWRKNRWALFTNEDFNVLLAQQHDKEQGADDVPHFCP